MTAEAPAPSSPSASGDLAPTTPGRAVPLLPVPALPLSVPVLPLPDGPEAGIGALLWPRYRALRNAPRSRNGQGKVRLTFFAVLGLAFMAGSFFGARWLFTLFLQAEFLAELLVRRVLEMVLLFFSGLLVFSNTISGFSTLLLADDLPLLAAAPVRTGRLFLARLAENWLSASWMMLVFALPILAASGPVLGAGPGFYLALPLTLVPLTLICAAVGTMLTLLLARLLPAQRTQELLLLLAVLGFLSLYVAFRAAEPERFLNPDGFANLMALVGDLEADQQNQQPAAWALSVVFGLLRNTPVEALRPALMLSAGALAALTLATWTARLTWRDGMRRSFEGRAAGEPGWRGKLWARVRRLGGEARYPGSPMRALLSKETRVFFRSTGQWTQLLLIATLVVVYVFNFKYFRSLQATGIVGRSGLFLAHVGLGGLVLTTVAARFLYPSLSLEGRAWWVLAAAPITPRDVLAAKARWGLWPLLILGVCLAIAGDQIVGLSWPLATAAVAVSALTSYGLAGLAVGLGAADPRFDESNPARIAGGVGGVVFMLSGLGFVLLLTGALAVPVFTFDRWLARGVVPSNGRVVACVILCLLAIGLGVLAHRGALALGARRLAEYER